MQARTPNSHSVQSSFSIDLTFFSVGVTYFNHWAQNYDLGWEHQSGLLNGALVKHCRLSFLTLHGCGKNCSCPALKLTRSAVPQKLTVRKLMLNSPQRSGFTGPLELISVRPPPPLLTVTSPQKLIG